MKNLVLILAALSYLSFNACQKDQLFGEENPVKIQEFKIDGEDYDQNELFATEFKLSVGEGIRLHYLLQDDRKIKVHSLYYLVNGDDFRRSQIVLEEDMDSEWLHVEQYFRLANLIRLESDEIYSAQPGDRLHFNLEVEDKAGNESVRRFMVEVE